MSSDLLPSKDDIGRAVEDVLDGTRDDLGGVVVGTRPQVRVDETLGEVVEDAPIEDPTPAWARKLVHVLDDGVKIPGTEFGIGLDGVIGFFLPGVGDMVTGGGSLALVFLAFKEKIPTVALARMVLNIAIDTLGGAFPIIGDVFDIFWKSNRKNLDIIAKYRDNPAAKPTAVDYLLLVISIVLVITSVFLPFIVLWLLAGAGIVAFDSILGE